MAAESTHCADIHPQPVADSDSVRLAPSYSRIDANGAVLGNGLFEVQLGHAPPRQGVAVFLNKLTDEAISVTYSPLEASFDVGTIKGEDGAFGPYEAFGSGEVASLRSVGSFGWFDIELSYNLRRGDHFLQKLVVFRGLKRKALLHKVTLFRHHLAEQFEMLLHDGGMYFPIAFMRSQKGGLFYCVDFPGYFATLQGRVLSFDYYPGELLEPGRVFQTLTAHIGVTVLTGRYRVNPYHESGARLDVGEQAWFREYLMRGACAAELPYLEIKGPGFDTCGVSELELLDQCEALGVHHVLMPRMLNSLDAYPLADIVKARMAREGVSAALVVSQLPTTRNLRWVALAPDGASVGPDFSACLGSDDYRDFIIEHYVGLMERHQLRNVEVEGAPIVECYSTGHNHRPARESIQKAFKGLVEVAAALKENFAHLRCGVLYGSYGTGMVKLFDDVALLADDHPLPLPDIHVGRLFADMGRLYFRRAHDFLLPKSKLSNSVGLVPESSPHAPYPGAESYPWYLYHDSAGWRYGLLSAIAVGVRHRFHALPQDLSEEDRAFARDWLAWEKENLSILMDLEEILDEPGLNMVDGYSSVSEGRAILMLFNSGYDAQDVQLRLCLGSAGELLVREVYPRELNYLGPNSGFFAENNLLDLVMQPKEARVIEVLPRPTAYSQRRRPQVFGLETLDTPDGLLLRGPAGTSVRIGVNAQQRYAEKEVHLAGTAISPHLRRWSCMLRTFEDGVATLAKGGWEDSVPASNTLGASAGVVLAGLERSHESSQETLRNVWLGACVKLPVALQEQVDCSPFKLMRPCWSYPQRLFFVIRVEPRPHFDPIRTSSGVLGIPEAYQSPVPIKCGIDLAPLNLGLRAWINGVEATVYPAIAAWQKFTPNACPIVAYFFEAGSLLSFGEENRVVLFARNFDPEAFRGIYIEHLPRLEATMPLDEERVTSS